MDKEEKLFQYKLAFFVFALTVIASIISGWVIFQLTNNERPLLVLTVLNYTKSSDEVWLQINNFRETPANQIYINYQINGLVGENRQRELLLINELYKESIEVSFPFKKIRNNIIWSIEDFLDDTFENLPDGSEIKIYSSDGIVEIGTGESINSSILNEYEITLFIGCNNCQKNEIVINDYDFEYEGEEFLCVKDRTYFDCSLLDERVSI